MKKKEAFKKWYEAYTKNYGDTGLTESKVIAEQAWYAAIDYASRVLKDEAE